MSVPKSLILCLAIKLAFAISYSYAQEPFFKSIQIEREIRDVHVNCFTQDRSGIIWVGTDKGLWSYNGIDFRPHSINDSIDDASVTAIYIDDDHMKYVGFRDGQLWQLSERNSQLMHLGDTVSSQFPINSIVSFKGSMIAFTYGNGFLQIKSDTTILFNDSNILLDNFIYTSFIDEDDNIWIGSDRGLSKIFLGDDSIRVKNFTTKDGLSDNIVKVILSDNNGGIWLGFDENGVGHFNMDNELFTVPEKLTGWVHGSVNDIIQLKNEIWIATDNGMVDYEFSGYHRIRELNVNENGSGSWNELLHDKNDNVWISDGDRIFFTPGESVEILSFGSTFNFKNISCVLASNDGLIWFSTDSGLFNYEPFVGEEPIVTGPILLPGIQNSKIISLYEDQNEMIWIGMFDKGVVRFDPVTGLSKHFTDKDGLVNNSVLSIDGNNEKVWFATLGGVSSCSINSVRLFEELKFINYTQENGLGTNFVYKVLVDSKDRVWFGTDGKGVTVYENERFQNFNSTNGFDSPIVYSIAEDKEGDIWFSTLENGLYSYQEGTFVNSPTVDGLSEPDISALACDANGNMLVFHKNGIDVFDPVTGFMNTYGNEIGLDEIDPDLNCVAHDRDGNTWVGTAKGLLKLSLDIGAGNVVPQVFISKVFVYLNEVDSSIKSFGYDENHISFEFESLWYLNPDDVNFQYRLTSNNNNWITTRDRNVTFPNLSPGEYEFQIKGAFQNNFRNSELISYKFVIEKPIWRRTWFLSILSLILMIGFYKYIKVRERRMNIISEMKKDQILTQYENLKNQVNPHFLFNSFNTLISVIETDQKVAVEYVNKLSDFFRTVLTFKEKDLITLKEEIELVSTYEFLQHKRYGSNFVIKITIPESLTEQVLVPPLAVQLLVENSLKHNAISKESQLIISITYQEEVLVISNNINPKLKKETSTGTGLDNIKNRIKIITGKEVKVQQDATHYTVYLPLIKLQQ